MNLDEALDRMCNPGDPRALCHAPHSITIGGVRYALGTSHAAMLMIPSDADYPDAMARPLAGRLLDTLIADWMSRAHVFTRSAGAVRAWAGPDTSRRCRACGGTGGLDDECGACQGVGETGFEDRYGYVADVAVNRRWVAKVAWHVPVDRGETVVIKTEGRADNIAMRWEGCGWWLFTMPLMPAAGSDPYPFMTGQAPRLAPGGEAGGHHE